jgi:hypothetical protein
MPARSVALLAWFGVAQALDNGLALRPPRAWRSWNGTMDNQNVSFVNPPVPWMQ